MERIIIYTDGGSRGNPGPAAAGYVLIDSRGNEICGRGVFLGKKTNNEAEYTAFIKSLEAATELKALDVLLYSDSELLVRQVNGVYRVKSDKIRPLYEKGMELLGGFQSWEVVHVTREKNEQADMLVNQSLDKKRDVEMKVSKKAPKGKPLRLGVLMSGGGRTLMNIVDKIKAGDLNAEVVVAISSLSKVKGVERAKKAGVETIILRRKDCSDIDSFSSKLVEELKKYSVDLVVQAGWLCLWKISADFKNKVMNIHPALLPSFGGQGMWGHHVHEAVLAAGCKVSGCTVHFCTNEYDKGPIIVQRCCAVSEDDTAVTLASRVFEEECKSYPEAIRLFEQGRLKVSRMKVTILK